MRSWTRGSAHPCGLSLGDTYPSLRGTRPNLAGPGHLMTFSTRRHPRGAGHTRVTAWNLSSSPRSASSSIVGGGTKQEVCSEGVRRRTALRHERSAPLRVGDPPNREPRLIQWSGSRVLIRIAVPRARSVLPTKVRIPADVQRTARGRRRLPRRGAGCGISRDASGARGAARPVGQRAPVVLDVGVPVTTMDEILEAALATTGIEAALREAPVSALGRAPQAAGDCVRSPNSAY